MPDTTPPPPETKIDEAIAPYFAAVHVGMISIVQGFALSMLVAQNVLQGPIVQGWDWAYFLRGFTVFLLAIALWHAYVTQLAYVATLHWLHTLFPFLFGVLQFMLASPRVLKPSPDWHNLSFFMLLMSLTALTGAAAYANTLSQHKSRRTEMLFDLNFEQHSKALYSFWGKLHGRFAGFMVAIFAVFLVLAAVAKWLYRPCEEIVFPLFTTIVAALAIVVDARFLAEHSIFEHAVQPIYEKVYGKTATESSGSNASPSSTSNDH